MTHAAGFSLNEASAAFDRLAESYDELFTRSSIGRAQRGVVWSLLETAFHEGDHILELNCGTGEDAFFLSRRGVSILACDASAQMIEVAHRRRAAEAPQSPIQFKVLRTEDLGQLPSAPLFDGVLSNFSGLNCVEDLNQVAFNLASLTKPGAPVLICLSSRFCLWEILWFALHANVRKAFRRVQGALIAQVGEHSIPVWYPTIRAVRRSFAPSFRLRSLRAVGLAVPPSYVQRKAIAHSRMISRLGKIDRILGRLPFFRIVGDHVLLLFQRTHS
jgi:ubiquinone/menaquinone biosynthesis C-methylase UbiE